MKRLAVLGTPITPRKYLGQISGSSFCVSFFHKDKVDVDEIISLTGRDQILVLDSGAYSFWRNNGLSPTAEYWDQYIEWAADILNKCPMAVCIPPDFIDGSPLDNREMIIATGLLIPIERLMPVWHLNEALDLLKDYVELGHRYIAFGSTTEYGDQVNPRLHNRLSEAFDVVNQTISKGSGYSKPWIHLLRHQAISHLHPFNSADSANIAMNHHRHKNSDNHLHHLVERLKAKMGSTPSPNASSPADVAIDARHDEICIKHAKIEIKNKAAGRDIQNLDYSIYAPNLDSPAPVLVDEPFKLVG